MPVGEFLNQALSSTVSAYRPVKRDLLVQLPLVILCTVLKDRDVNLTSLYKICLTVISLVLANELLLGCVRCSGMNCCMVKPFAK